MHWLEQGQPAMMRALDMGPAHLPDGLFAGSPARILAGMKVHANTISHARLIALEDTFPRTREQLGDARFNRHSREYLEQDGVTAQTLANIGRDFATFLLEQGEPRAAADLARFEWLWLQSYHAADARPLMLAELAGIDPAALMEVEIARHPAAWAGPFDRSLHELIGREVAGLPDAEAVLLARPAADVLVSPASAMMVAMLEHARNPLAIGNLLAHCSETIEEGGVQEDAETTGALMQALIALLEAGALTRP